MSERVRYGIIGPSGIAQRRVIPAFSHTSKASLAAICSRDLETAQHLAAPHPGVKAYDRWEGMLDEVDAVYVASPVYCHLNHARQVLAAGKHLLLEKPLARSSTEARQILALAEKADVFAMEAYMMKFHPAHAAIREAITAGRIGRVVYARARLGCWYPDMPGSWRQDPHLAGGGALMDLGSHLLDLLSWFLGPPKEIRSLINTQLFNYSTEDSATVILFFAGGAHGIVESYFSLPDQAGAGVMEIIGTEGRILAEGTVGQNGDGSVTWQVFASQATYEAQQDTQVDSSSSTQAYAPFDLYAAQLDYFSDCIIRETPPVMNTLKNGLSIIELIEKAYGHSA